MYLNELDPACFLTAPGLVWQAALKKTKAQLDLLTDIKKVLEEEYATPFIDRQKLITNICKIMIKIKNHHIFNIGM